MGMIEDLLNEMNEWKYEFKRNRYFHHQTESDMEDSARYFTQGFKARSDSDKSQGVWTGYKPVERPINTEHSFFEEIEYEQNGIPVIKYLSNYHIGNR